MDKKYFFQSGRSDPKLRVSHLKKFTFLSKKQPYFVSLWTGEFKRRIGQQISPWSCVPTSYEVLSYLWFKNRGSRQEWLKHIKGWFYNGNAVFQLMPHDRKTETRARKAMEMKIVTTLKGNQITVEKLTKPRKYKHYGWVLFFEEFERPSKRPNGPHAHACVPISINGHVDLFVPAYNRNKFIRKATVWRYKNWNRIMKMKPKEAMLMVPK